MGQKIHPYGLRLGIVTDWKSRWYSEKDYAFQVNEDHQIRELLKRELKRGAVSRIDVERVGNNKLQVDVHTGRPGVVIGRGGSEAERLRTAIEKLSGRIVKFNVIEVQNPELDATLLARSVADQLEGRVSFRRAMKRAVSTALKAGAEGVRVQAAGRLGGADMGRREWYLEGRVPLHTLRADIDYGRATAATTVGAIGVQVWVYKGDVLPSVGSTDKIEAEARLAAGGTSQRRRSAKSRAEAAAGAPSKRIIEAGGGKRIVEAGGGKRREGGRRLIEAGGGRRPSAEEAQDQFEEARDEAESVVAAGAAEPVATEAAVETAETAAEAPAVAEAIETAVEPVTEEAAAPAPAADEASSEDSPVVEAPVEAKAVEEAAVEEAAVEEAAVEEAAVEEASIDESSGEEASTDAVPEDSGDDTATAADEEPEETA